jgi:hypothetical protein
MIWNLIYRWGFVFTSVIIFTISIVSNWETGDFPTFGVLISVSLAIAQVALLEIELHKMASGAPNLRYRDWWVETKLVTASRKDLFSDGRVYPTTDSSAQFSFVQHMWKDEYQIFGITISNDPNNRNEHSKSEGVVAHIAFLSAKEKEYQGRWWNNDYPLFPSKDTDLEQLRKIKINPGDPKRLVIAYKVADGNLFYPFDYKTHFQAAEQRKGHNLGKDNIEFQVILEGENIRPTKPLRFILLAKPNGAEIRRLQWWNIRRRI